MHEDATTPNLNPTLSLLSLEDMLYKNKGERGNWMIEARLEIDQLNNEDHTKENKKH